MWPEEASLFPGKKVSDKLHITLLHRRTEYKIGAITIANVDSVSTDQQQGKDLSLVTATAFFGADCNWLSLDQWTELDKQRI